MGQANTGNLLDAMSTIEELPAGDARDAPLELLAYKQTENGNGRQALRTASLITNPEMKAFALQDVGIFQGTSGNQVAAIETIENISRGNGRASALASLALVQAEKDDPSAGRTLQLATEAARDPEAKVEPYVFGTIAVTRAILKDLTGAQEIAANLKDAESRVWPLRNIAAMMAEAGDSRGALALAANEQDAYPKAYALLGTAEGIISHMETEAQPKNKTKSGGN